MSDTTEGGGFDLGAMLAQAQELQQKMLAAQQAAQAEEVEGTSGGGAVRIAATGAGEFTRVRIDPRVVDPAEVDLLEDLVLAALHDVSDLVAELSQQSVGHALGGLDLFGALSGGGPSDIDVREAEAGPEDGAGGAAAPQAGA